MTGHDAESLNCGAPNEHNPHRWSSTVPNVFFVCSGIPVRVSHPTTDPRDGRTCCSGCGQYVWPVIHSCKGIPVGGTTVTETERKPLLGEDAVSAAVDAWHLACHDEVSTLDGMRRAVAALGPAVAALVEAARADERKRIAALLSEYQDTIAGFAGGKPQLVALIAHLLTLDQP